MNTHLIECSAIEWSRKGLAILMSECPIIHSMDREILGRVHAFLRNRPAITQTLTYHIESAWSWSRGDLERPSFIPPPANPLKSAIELRQAMKNDLQCFNGRFGGSITPTAKIEVTECHKRP